MIPPTRAGAKDPQSQTKEARHHGITRTYPKMVIQTRMPRTAMMQMARMMGAKPAQMMRFIAISSFARNLKATGKRSLSIVDQTMMPM